MINRLLFFGLILLTFLLPWELDFPHLGFKIPIINTNLEIVSVVIIVIWLINKFNHRDKFTYTQYLNFSKPVLAFLIINIISAIFAVKAGWAVKFILKLSGGILIYLVIIDVVNTQSRIKILVNTLFITGFLVATIGVLERIIPGEIHSFTEFFSIGYTYLPQGNTLRVKSTFVYPNVLAMFLEVIILLSSGWYLQAKNKIHKILLAALILVSTESLVLTYSRGGMIGLYAGLFVLWMILRNNDLFRKESARFNKLVLFISLIFLITTLLDNIFFMRLQNIFNISDNPVKERFYLWLTAIHIFCDHPLLGAGPDNFRWVYADKYALVSPFSSLEMAGGIPSHHSNHFYLEMFANSGFIGGIIFLWLVIEIIVKQYKTIITGLSGEMKLPVIGIFCVFISFFVHGLLDYFWHFQSIIFLFWICLGLYESGRQMKN